MNSNVSPSTVRYRFAAARRSQQWRYYYRQRLLIWIKSQKNHTGSSKNYFNINLTFISQCSIIRRKFIHTILVRHMPAHILILITILFLPTLKDSDYDAGHPVCISKIITSYLESVYVTNSVKKKWANVFNYIFFKQFSLIYISIQIL